MVIYMKLMLTLLLSLSVMHVKAAGCEVNLYEKYASYRNTVLSDNVSLSEVILHMTSGHSAVENTPLYLKAIVNQESKIDKVQAYFYSCTRDNGYLFLKLESSEPDITRAYVQFNREKSKFKIKAVSLENKSTEDDIDSEGRFVEIP